MTLKSLKVCASVESNEPHFLQTLASRIQRMRRTKLVELTRGKAAATETCRGSRVSTFLTRAVEEERACTAAAAGLVSRGPAASLQLRNTSSLMRAEAASADVCQRMELMFLQASLAG